MTGYVQVALLWLLWTFLLTGLAFIILFGLVKAFGCKRPTRGPVVPPRSQVSPSPPSSGAARTQASAASSSSSALTISPAASTKSEASACTSSTSKAGASSTAAVLGGGAPLPRASRLTEPRPATSTTATSDPTATAESSVASALGAVGGMIRGMISPDGAPSEHKDLPTGTFQALPTATATATLPTATATALPTATATLPTATATALPRATASASAATSASSSSGAADSVASSAAARAGAPAAPPPASSPPSAPLQGEPLPEWWEDLDPVMDDPITCARHVGRGLQLLAMPLLIFLASIEIVTQILESSIGGHRQAGRWEGGRVGGRLRPGKPYGPNPFFLIFVFYQICILIPGAFIWLALTFLSWDELQIQKDMDAISDDGATTCAFIANQLVLALMARFGTRPAYFAMAFLWCTPSGATEQKGRDAPEYRNIRAGSFSAVARAYVRGDASVVGFFLHHAPYLKLQGSLWTDDRITTGSSVSTSGLKDWVRTTRAEQGAAGFWTAARCKSLAAVLLGTTVQVVLVVVIMVASWDPPCNICPSSAVKIDQIAGHRCLSPSGSTVAQTFLDPHTGEVGAGTARTESLCSALTQALFNASRGESLHCMNDCNYASDGDCDDGGEGSEFNYCGISRDCDDCGARQEASSGYTWKEYTCEDVADYYLDSGLGGPQAIKTGPMTCAEVSAFWHAFPIVGSSLSAGIDPVVTASCCTGSGTA
jgi:hypothetical protein